MTRTTKGLNLVSIFTEGRDRGAVWLGSVDQCLILIAGYVSENQ